MGTHRQNIQLYSGSTEVTVNRRYTQKINFEVYDRNYVLNVYETTNYSTPAPSQDSSDLCWIEGIPTNYLDLGVTLSKQRWPYLQVIVLWIDTRDQ